MRKKVVAGNFKMNKTAAETAEIIAELKPLVKGVKCEVVLCVPFTSIAAAKKAAKGSKIAIGAQNVGWADSGAFTGEVSAAQLLEQGVKYVVVGHSERRQFFGETNEGVNKRALQALKNGLKPIVCIGETEQEREDGLTNSVLAEQVNACLANISEDDVKNLIIAYEPVWAIGTGKTATAEDANTCIKFIRAQVKKLLGRKFANGVRIQYGGSMNAKNARELMSMSDIDGGLIGGASLKAADFSVCVLGAEAVE